MSQVVSTEMSNSLEDIIQKAFIEAQRSGTQVIYKNKSGEIVFCEDCYKNNMLYELEDIIGKVVVCCGLSGYVDLQGVK